MALSDLLRPRVCELGKIKIGKKESEARTSRSGGQWRAPVKLDHFIVTTLRRDENENYVVDDAIMAGLAEMGMADADGKLRQIPIRLLSHDVGEVMESAYVAYQGKRVAARSDGRTLTKFFDSRSNAWLDKPQELPWEPKYADAKDAKGNPLFKLHTVFNCVIAADQSRWGGVYKFRTTSRISADQLYGSLVHVRELTNGVLRGMPLRLVVRPMQVSPQGKATTVHVVHVELRGSDLQDLQQKALDLARWETENKKLIEASRREYQQLMLPPGRESPAEAAAVAEEFHPEAAQAPPSGPDPLLQTLGIQGGSGDVVDGEIVDEAG